MENIVLRNLGDEQIVGLIRSGNENAFEEIISRYEASVYRLSSLFTGSNAIAEEVLARVFCELYVRIHELSPTLDVQEFIFSSTVEQSDLLKSHIPVEERDKEATELSCLQIEFDFSDEDFFENLPLHKWSSPRLRYKLRSTFDLAPVDYKRALVLHDVLGIPTARIGRILSRAIPEVRLLVFRARVTMRAFLRCPGSLPCPPPNHGPNLRGSHHCDA